MSYLQGEEAFKILLDELKDALREQFFGERAVAELQSKLSAIDTQVANAERLHAAAVVECDKLKSKLRFAEELWIAAKDAIAFYSIENNQKLHEIVQKTEVDLGPVPF